ncbi:FAD-binding oxidoreductase [Pseudomonas sp. dw_358]|uniref:NAD(P)/FAD-dependent oxidoreductase n=1 Tax=Pseudomonas sp. dw_358 TaxID=2720083 RepID=UPI001BD20ABD|nr:FAD-binding oxidoreductase [Pseudomonas sp. dw_358]
MPSPQAVPALPSRARCVIIGAGYTGLNSALEIARTTGGEGVVVLDSLHIGEGASGRNGGQVIPGLKLDPDTLIERFGVSGGAALIEAVGGAADYTFDLIKRLGIDCDARQCGWLQAAHTEGTLRVLSQRAEQWQRHGADVRMLDRQQTQARLGTSIYHGALLDTRAGQLQPYQYALGLGAAARAQGVTLLEQTRALSMSPDAQGWTLSTSRGDIHAEQIVIATNAYSPALLPGLPQTYVTLWSLQAATVPLPDELAARILPGDLPVSDTFRVLRYFRRSHDGRFVLGTRGAFRDELGAGDARRVRDEMLSLYPELDSVPLSHCWCGRVAVPASTIPFLSQPAKGVTVALGYYGRGVAMATRMGGFVADLVNGLPAAHSAYPVLPFKPFPAAPLHRSAARITANVMRLRDLLERRLRAGAGS